MNHKATIQLFIEEVFNKGNLNVLHELLHPDYRYASPTEKMESPQELAGFVAVFGAAFPDLNIKILDQVSEANTVVTRIRLSGSHQADYFGIPPTGKSVDVEGCVFSRFVDGLIAEEWEILDQLTLLQQLEQTA